MHLPEPPNSRIFFPDWSEVYISENETFLMPIDMRFNEGHKLSIAFYLPLMLLSAAGNITVLSMIISRKKRVPSRINVMLINLAIADLLVTFLLMPVEIFWAATVAWRGGDALCRVSAFFRSFGLYLSSFVLVCISIDRYFAVIKPMKLVVSKERGKIMLIIAWTASFLCSFPQSLVFREQVHPVVSWYKQCASFNAFPSQLHELSYSLFGMVMMYALPLIIMIYSYSSIFLEICRRQSCKRNDKIRRSSNGFLNKAKNRTLKMTVAIVMAFILCWTPYHVMAFWWWFDRDSAMHVDPRIQRGLFFFACTNSCVNPVVYGIFNIRSRKSQVARYASTNTCTTELKSMSSQVNSRC